MEAIKPFFNYLAIPAVILLGVEFVISLVYLVRSIRQPGDTRRMLILGMVLQLLSVWIVLQNALILPRLLPDFLHLLSNKSFCKLRGGNSFHRFRTLVVYHKRFLHPSLCFPLD